MNGDTPRDEVIKMCEERGIYHLEDVQYDEIVEGLDSGFTFDQCIEMLVWETL